MKPSISVVMSIYNNGRYLKKAIDSVLSQTFTDFEFIIIDDGSSDNSCEIVSSYNDSRIIFVKQNNTGLAQALNNGIALIKSNLIARMDADDICLENRLDVQYEFMLNNPDILAIGSAANYMDEYDNPISTVRMPETHEQILNYLPQTPFIHPSVMMRSKAFLQVGGYPTKFSCAENMPFYNTMAQFICPEDMLFFNKMAQFGKLHNLQVPLLRYRINPTSVGRWNKKQTELIKIFFKKSIENKSISEKEIEAFNKMGKKATKKEKLFSYHMFLAKLFLQDSNTKQAQRHFFKAIKMNVIAIEAWGGIFLSLLPSFAINIAYQALKKTLVSKN